MNPQAILVMVFKFFLPADKSVMVRRIMLLKKSLPVNVFHFGHSKFWRFDESRRDPELSN